MRTPGVVFTVSLLIMAFCALFWLVRFHILLLVDLASAKFLLTFRLDEVSLPAAPSFCDLADLNLVKNLLFRNEIPPRGHSSRLCVPIEGNLLQIFRGTSSKFRLQRLRSIVSPLLPQRLAN